MKPEQLHTWAENCFGSYSDADFEEIYLLLMGQAPEEDELAEGLSSMFGGQSTAQVYNGSLPPDRHAKVQEIFGTLDTQRSGKIT